MTYDFWELIFAHQRWPMGPLQLSFPPPGSNL